MEMPWQAVLTEEERARGISFYGSGGRLRAVGRRLLEGQPIHVHLLGGSITAQGRYAELLAAWLNASFPHS
jgi:hypothetical protein